MNNKIELIAHNYSGSAIVFINNIFFLIHTPYTNTNRSPIDKKEVGLMIANGDYLPLNKKEKRIFSSWSKLYVFIANKINSKLTFTDNQIALNKIKKMHFSWINECINHIEYIWLADTKSFERADKALRFFLSLPKVHENSELMTRISSLNSILTSQRVSAKINLVGPRRRISFPEKNARTLLIPVKRTHNIFQESDMTGEYC